MSVKNKVATNSLICYFIIVVIFAMVRMLSAFGVFDGLGAEADYIFNVIIQVVILFALSILLFSLFQKNKIKDTFRFFGCKKIINIFVATFFNSILSLFGYSVSSSTTYMESYPFWLFIVNILITAVLPGICEEIAHRGLLLKGMSGLGQAKALILSSLLFGFMHMNIQQFFYATLIGFLVGYLALICDSIYPAMIIHFMNNALSVFAGYSSFNNLGFEKIIGSLNVILQSNIILGFLFVVLFLVALVYLLMILIKLLFRETTMKNMKKLQLQIMKQLQKDAYLKELEATKNDEQIEKQNQVTLSFEEFDKLYKENNQKLGLMSKIDKEITSPNKEKMSLVNKILLTGIFVITAGVTIFTFVWGIL